jgi:hypothetical protein
MGSQCECSRSFSAMPTQARLATVRRLAHRRRNITQQTSRVVTLAHEIVVILSCCPRRITASNIMGMAVSVSIKNVDVHKA